MAGMAGSRRYPDRTPSPGVARAVDAEKTVQQQYKVAVAGQAGPSSNRIAPYGEFLLGPYYGSPGSLPELSLTPESKTSSKVFDCPSPSVEDFPGIDDFLMAPDSPTMLDDPSWKILFPPQNPGDSICHGFRSGLLPEPSAPAPSVGHDVPEEAEPISSLSVSEHCTLHSNYSQTSQNCHSETRNQLPLQECLPTPSASKLPLIAKWLFQSKRSFSSSETNSVGSLESEITDEFEEADISICRENNDVDGIPSDQGAVALDFTALFMQALAINNVPRETVSELYTTLTILIESWVSNLPMYQSAASEDTSLPPLDNAQTGRAPENTQSSHGGQKRSLGDDDKESSERDDNSRKKRPKLCRIAAAKYRQKWACPFYQREPHRYCVETEIGDFRKCARSPGFDQVHRVKDHIYKCHSPKYCERCYTFFKEEDDLTNHRRLSPACDVVALQKVDGLTSEQKKLLKPRDRSNKSEEERWQTIYKICFPEDEIIPSAHYIHYSREIAELRREVFAIIEGEARSPGPIDVIRMVQRLQGAFNNQFLSQSSTMAIPPTPEALTPSTTNASHSSTGRSSQVQLRDEYLETPSLRRATRHIAEATGLANNLAEHIGDERSEESAATMAVAGPPVWTLSATHIPESDNSLGLGLIPSIPFPGLLDDVELCDFDTFFQ